MLSLGSERPLRRRLGLKRDHTVVPTLSAVHDARVVGAHIDEEEEVVADQFHAVNRFFDRHPLSVEALRADHDGRVPLFSLMLHRHCTSCDRMQDIDRSGFDIDTRQRTCLLLEMRSAGVLTSVDALLLRSSQLLGELVDSKIQRDELVAVDSFCSNDGTLADERQLDGLVWNTPAAIRTMRDLHVQPLRFRCKRLNLGELLLDNSSEAISDAHTNANDARFHCVSLSRSSRPRADRCRLVTPTVVPVPSDVTAHS